MITVIIQGTKNIDNTLKSLKANAKDPFRVFVEDSVREELSKTYDIEFVKPGLVNKYGKKSDLYWLLPSGCLVLTAFWDARLSLCIKKTKVTYCLQPSGHQKYFVTNFQSNIDKWKGRLYSVPILQVIEV